MRRCLLLLLAACGQAAAPPPAPPQPAQAELVIAPIPPAADAAPPPPAERVLEPLRDAVCTIHDTKGMLLDPLDLTVHGKAFARVHRLGDLEVRIGADAATASFGNDDVAIVGEVSPAGLRARPPRDAKAWLDVRFGHTKTAAAESITLDVVLPNGLVPRTPPSFTYRCTEVSLAEGKRAPKAQGTLMLLKAGVKTPLRDANGVVVADLVAPAATSSDPGVDVHVVERRGKQARVQLESEDVLAEGWIDASVLETAGGLGYGTGRGSGGAGVPLRCEHEVAIFVHDGDAVVRVGKVRANGAIQTPPRKDEPEDELPIDLGAYGKNAVRPFVRAAEVKGCTRG